MSISMVLTDICPIRQKLRIKNIFGDIAFKNILNIYYVLAMKK